MNEIEIKVDKELEEKELKAVEGSDEKPKLENVENRIRNTVETKDLTFIDGILVTWEEIFNKILDRRLRDDNGDPEGLYTKAENTIIWE